MVIFCTKKQTHLMQNMMKQYLNQASFIKKIFSPYQSLNLSGVFYLRIYPNGTIINLPSCAAWTDFYFKQIQQARYQNKDLTEQFIYPEVSLWQFNKENIAWQEANSYFGYQNGIIINEDHPQFQEIICFYSKENEQKMTHFYLNKLDVLKKIKQHFLVTAHSIIEKAEQERQLNQHIVFPKKLLDSQESIGIDIINTVSKTPLSLLHNQTGVPITIPLQRSKCLFHLIQGKSVKVIARCMALSPKTIEHYLEILRNELGCRNSKELMLQYSQQISLVGREL